MPPRDEFVRARIPINPSSRTISHRSVPRYRDAFYTTLFNILDYSTSVFPVTFSDKNLDKAHPPYPFRNHEDEVIYNLCTYSPLSVSRTLWVFEFKPDCGGSQMTRSCSTGSRWGCSWLDGCRRKRR